MNLVRKNLNKLFILLTIVFLAGIVTNNAMSCTGIEFQVMMPDTNGVRHVFAGRTMEFGPDVTSWKVLFVPRDSDYQSCRLTSVNGKSILETCIGDKDKQIHGYAWKVKYNYVGFTPMRYLKDPDDPKKRFEYTMTEITDGINEEGLYCGGFYHMRYEQYSRVPYLIGQPNMSSMDFVAWVLGQFDSVKELRKRLESKNEGDAVLVRQFDIDLFGIPLDKKKMPQLHYQVVDKHGDAIVIEFVDGKPKVFDSAGVITNDPHYDWQVTNLSNYVNLRNDNYPSIKFMDNTYEMLSNGTGGLGLPGDFTSPSRFIRAMYFLDATLKNNNITTPDEAIGRAFKILNQFDIPEGSVVEPKKDPSKKPTMEATSWTSMADLKNRVYYYHTMFNRTIRRIDLDALKFNKKTKAIELPEHELIIDETGKLMLQQ